jgi:hypothetical protein
MVVFPDGTDPPEVEVVACDQVLDAILCLDEHRRIPPWQEVDKILERLEAGVVAAGLARDGGLVVVAEECPLGFIASEVFVIDLDPVVKNAALDAHRDVMRAVVPRTIGLDGRVSVGEAWGDWLDRGEVEGGARLLGGRWLEGLVIGGPRGDLFLRRGQVS